MTDLSVCITTYNLEKVLNQTLESVFAQNTAYSYEVLIGDDGSQDGTISIVRFWQERFPKVISLYTMPREKGKKYNSIFRASANRINLLRHAKGKYITFLDGDDFYIDNNKFQRQIDLLVKNPGCSICAHNMNYFYPKTSKVIPIVGVHRDAGIIRAKEYWKKRMYTPCEACIMRNEFDIRENDVRYFDDNFIIFLALQKGDCYYIPDIMANYRQNENGYMKWDEEKCAVVNMLDCDMEVQINPRWEKASLSRHFEHYMCLLKSKEQLEVRFPELYQQAVKDHAVYTLNLMNRSGRMKPGIRYFLWNKRIRQALLMQLSAWKRAIVSHGQ